MSHVLKIINVIPYRRFLSQNLNNFRPLTTQTKELAKQNTLGTQTDLIINNLKGSPTVQNVLDIVDTHHNVMNSYHVIQALNRIFMLQKQKRTEYTPQELINKTGFEQLCNKLKQDAGTLDPKSTIEAVKVLTYFEVPSNSTIFQTMLQILRHNLNQLPLKQIMFLDFILTKSDRTPLTDALQIALPIVFETQLPIQIDRHSPQLLTEYLFYVSKRSVSDSTVDLVCDNLLKLRLDLKSAVSVLWSLGDLPSEQCPENLMNKVMKIVVKYSNDVRYQDLETILTKLTYRFMGKFPHYYNRELYEAIADRVVSDDLGFEYAVHYLRKVLKTAHFNQRVLDYAVEYCYQNIDLIKVGDPFHVYSLICSCALTDYIPKHVNMIKEAMQNFDVEALTHKEINFARFALSLACLDIYQEEALKKAFDINYLNNLFKKKYLGDPETVLVLSQAVKTFKPELCDLLPDERFLESTRALIKPLEFPLEGLLHNVFGGLNNVATNISSKMHHVIDHAILLRKGGFPIPIDKSIRYIEDIPLESSSEIVLILALSPFHYSLNIKRIKGVAALMIKTLEAKGYSVVPIDVGHWSQLPDFEKIPYVMEAIKERTNYMQRLSDCS